MAILRRPEHFWPALWIGIAAALVVVIALEYQFGGVTVGDGPRAPAKVIEAKLLPAFALAPETQSAPETVGRPLFVPTRRPAPPPATTAVQTMKRGQFVLTGVTVTPELSFAFLKEIANGKTLSVKKGSQVNGLAVDKVEPRRVVLRQGDELEELALNVQVPARIASAPVPASAPGAAPGVPPGMPSGPEMPPSGTMPPQAPPRGGVPATPANPQGVPAGAADLAPIVTGSARRRPWINSQ